MPIITGDQPLKASQPAVQVRVVRPRAGPLVQATTVIQGVAFIPCCWTAPVAAGRADLGRCGSHRGLRAV
jgi:hypothetical protein